MMKRYLHFQLQSIFITTTSSEKFCLLEYDAMYSVESQHTFETNSYCYLLHAGFLLGLFLDPEDRGDMFLHNVGIIRVSVDYMALYSYLRRQKLLLQKSKTL
jgi:hypothetical protein